MLAKKKKRKTIKYVLAGPECIHACRLASRAMAVTNRVSANRVLSGSDLAKQYQTELLQLRHHLSRRASGEEQSAAVATLKQQVSFTLFSEKVRS